MYNRRGNAYFGVIMFFTTIAFIILSRCDGFSTSYRNHALLHGIPRNERELKFFQDMAQLYNVTFWRKPAKVWGAVEFTISPHNYAELMIDTHQTKIRFRTVMEDVQSAFDKQTVKRYTRREMNTFNWDNFYGLDDIYTWLKDLSSSFPGEVKLLPIGKSYENRDIFAVKLKLNNATTSKKRNRPKVMIEGGCHGREWLSPAVVTYMIHALLNAESSNSEELKLVAPMYDWLFVPVMNPDGYVYSQTHDRLWKKTRRNGYGVDLNRNFGILFGKQGSKTNKYHEEYCGKGPFSEPESTALASFARDNSVNLEYYVSFHAYGQYIILPYSFSRSHEDNYESTKILADKVARKIFLKYNVKYEVGTSYDTLGYLASGLSTDWVKRAINVTHVASIRLPDTGAYGFAVPPDEILPTCQATLDGLLNFFNTPKPMEERFVEFKDGTQENRASYGILFLCYMIVCICDRLK